LSAYGGLALFDFCRRLPQRTGQNQPLVAYLKVGQAESVFFRLAHDRRHHLHIMRFGFLTVVVAAIKRVGQNFLRLQVSGFRGLNDAYDA